MKTGFIYIDNNIYDTLLAVSCEEQQRGLMEHNWPPPIMSFIYPYPQNNKFWMHMTPSPLDIVFSKNGNITQICHGKPFDTSIIGDDSLSDLVVEFPYGTVISSKINIGNKIGLIKPTMAELQTLITKKYSKFI